MADQVKQLAFKKFTQTELENGTAANVLTTDASTHYVIKGIEATQGNNNDPITADATIGLTAGLAAGEFTSLGTVAKANRVGLSGSAIMDASSTLTIRPVAKSITYTDEIVQYALESSYTPRKFRVITTPTVNGNTDTDIITRNTIDKTSVTFSGNSYTQQTYSNNHSFIYTRSDGVNLKVLVFCGQSSSTGFEVFNADDGTYYGYYSANYAMPWWDGGRYIWMWREANPQQIIYYDLEESLTNLAANNTYGGGNGLNFYHGILTDPTFSLPYYSMSTWDNRRGFFCYDRHNNKKFIGQWFAGNTRLALVELPTTTLTNYATSNNIVKFILLGSGSSSGGTDPFGNNANSTWSSGYCFSNYMVNNATAVRMTYDTVKNRYLLYCWEGTDAYMFTFTLDEYNSTSVGSLLDQDNQGYGLQLVADNSNSDIGFSSTWFNGYSGSNGALNMNDLSNNVASWTWQQSNERWVDGANIIMTSQATPNHVYKINLNSGTTTVITSGLTDTEVNVNSNKSLWHGFGTPSASTTAGRNYTVAPSLKIRVTGVLSDQ